MSSTVVQEVAMDARPREHPVPTHREVVMTALDQQQRGFDLRRLLAERGINLARAYTKEPREGGDGDVYAQEIADDER
jgi:hypothetical protein